MITYGDTVTVKQIAPKWHRPRSYGSVCGIRTIDSIDMAKQFDQPVGSVLYLIEFSDGEALEIPKIFLSLSSD